MGTEDTKTPPSETCVCVCVCEQKLKWWVPLYNMCTVDVRACMSCIIESKSLPLRSSITYTLCSPVEDEYDQYRAKYRLFDSALFLMSPDNILRRCCKAILTRQMSEPLLIKTRLTPLILLRNIVSYYGR